MTDKKKRFGHSLNTKLFLYFGVFSVVMIVLLWIFQIYFLEDTYRYIKVNQLKKTSQSVRTLLMSDYHDSELEAISLDKNISITIVDNTLMPRIVYSNNFNELGNMFSMFVTANLDNIVSGSIEDNTLLYLNEGGRDGRFISYSDKYDGNNRAVVCITQATRGTSNYVILTFGTIMPVSATVEALRFQLAVITIILLIIAFVISFFASRRIARPISVLNEKAKILADGNYSVTFNGEGYDEIEELSDTLNTTAIQLGKADQITKDLIANVSHDLRTPLTMISGYGEIIRDIPGENNPENVQVIIDEANRLTSLVNNLLDISKLQSGTVTLDKTDINANELLNRVCGSYQKMLDSRGYTIDLENEESECYIHADPTRIEQVFYNLINNAITHIGEDRQVIIRSKKEDDCVRFDVIDHGEGIPKEEIPLIWQRYYKVDKTHIRPETGSGLGLSIVKTILDLHQADYGVISDIDQGADFWFRLPIVK